MEGGEPSMEGVADLRRRRLRTFDVDGGGFDVEGRGLDMEGRELDMEDQGFDVEESLVGSSAPWLRPLKDCFV